MVTNRVTDEAVAREKISQWMDGGADEEEGNSVYAELKNSAGRDTWALYHYIGDTLREGAQSGAGLLSPGFTARVMQALADEPTTQIPQAVAASTSRGVASSEIRPRYRVWALAAMVAGVAVIGGLMVVGGLVFTFRNDAGAPAMIASGTVAQPVVTAEPSTTTLPADESISNGVQASEASIPLDYLITYQEFLPLASLWPDINVFQWMGDVKTPCRCLVGGR